MARHPSAFIFDGVQGTTPRTLAATTAPTKPSLRDHLLFPALGDDVFAGNASCIPRLYINNDGITANAGVEGNPFYPVSISLGTASDYENYWHRDRESLEW